jgi:hypothetical protein
MRHRAWIAALAAVTLSACYHITVSSGAPSGAQVIDKPWQLSFVYGLIPPPEISAKETCPQGVAKVETERSFLNSIVAGVTWQLVTPLHARVTCASGPVPR